MIRVTIELLPFGKEEGKKLLKIVDIANDGTGTEMRGNYKARLNPRNGWTEKVVENFPRKSYDAAKLLYLTLKKFYD